MRWCLCPIEAELGDGEEWFGEVDGDGRGDVGLGRLPFRADCAVYGAEGELAGGEVAVGGDGLALGDVVGNGFLEAGAPVGEG